MKIFEIFTTNRNFMAKIGGWKRGQCQVISIPVFDKALSQKPSPEENGFMGYLEINYWGL